jgi:hypothetical protein
MFKRDPSTFHSFLLKELPICNNYYGLRGKLDKIEFIRHGNKLTINITELKSGWQPYYILQVMAYGLMVSNKFAMFIIEDRKKKKRAYRLYERYVNLSVDINVTIQIFNSKKPMRWKFMEDNLMTEFAKGFCMGIMRRLNDYRQLHHRQLIYLGEVPQCKVCKGQQCYYYLDALRWQAISGSRLNRCIGVRRNYSSVQSQLYCWINYKPH